MALASLKCHEAIAEQALAQQEDAENFADKLLDVVLGQDRPEWSSAYGFAQALADVEEAMAAPRKPAQPAGLVGRVEAALKRIEDGHGIRRIPAEDTDPDLVLAEVKAFLEGRWPPFWIGVDLAAGPDQTVYHHAQAIPTPEDTGPLETSEDMAVEPPQEPTP